MMFCLLVQVLSNCTNPHAAGTPGQKAPRPEGRTQLQLQTAFTRGVGLDGLNNPRDGLLWSKAEQATELVWVSLAFQQMVFVPLANLADYGQQNIRLGVCGKYSLAAMRSEAEVIMELVRPRNGGERVEKHEVNLQSVLLRGEALGNIERKQQDAKNSSTSVSSLLCMLDLNKSTNAVGGILGVWFNPFHCRLDVNNPPTAVGGIFKVLVALGLCTPGGVSIAALPALRNHR